MSYGINIYNASGNLIINQDYSNYHVVSSGTVTNASNFPTLATGEILYLRANTPGAKITSTVLGAIDISAGYAEYVILKKGPSPSGSAFGFRVYKSDGTTIAFDSGRAGAKIVSSYTKNGNVDGNITAWGTTLTQPFAVPTGRKRYVWGGWLSRLGALGINIMTGQSYYILNYITWTSDMQQTVGGAPTNVNYTTLWNLQGVMIINFVDI